MSLDRRHLVGSGLALAAGAAAVASGPRSATAEASGDGLGVNAIDLGLLADADADQSEEFARAWQFAVQARRPLLLPPGRYRVANVTMPAGGRLTGVPGASVLASAGDGPLLVARGAADLAIGGVVLDGAGGALAAGEGDGLMSFSDCAGVRIRDVAFRDSTGNGLSLRRSSGVVSDCVFSGCAETALFCLDGAGLDIVHNRIAGIGNNGIRIWRSEPGEDRGTVTANRIERIEARAGGSGQNGNGINIFRAAGVLVSGNTIADCAFSAVRANAASNCQIVGNACYRLGEVALYAEFAFEGVVIASNLVDQAAQGISVTNFNDGGRLAVVQGNLIRNLVTRPDSEDRRGIGISVEADCAVTGNVVEGAAEIGILVGWQSYKRDVAVVGNLVRKAKIGIGISSDLGGGLVFVTQNMIAGASQGGIRAMEKSIPVGPDLVRASPEAFPNLAVFANVAT